MIVCQCNMISDREIERIVLEFLVADPWQLVVPAMVYKELEKRAKCSGCVPNVVDIIVRMTLKYHQELDETVPESVVIDEKLQKLIRKRPGERRERRSTSHRAA